MATIKQVTTHEFVQHTSKYLKLSEKEGKLVITHHNRPRLYIVPIKKKTIYDLQGTLGKVKVHGDINDPILPGFDEW
jgi:prevent-host-death family protein